MFASINRPGWWGGAASTGFLMPQQSNAPSLTPSTSKISRRSISPRSANPQIIFALASAIALTNCSAGEAENAVFENLGSGNGGACEHDGIATGDLAAVSQEIILLDGPDGSRVLNEKASAALKTAHYQQVDSTATLREICRTENWSKVKVEEPSRLSHVEGWLPNSSLRLIEADTAGAREYVEADFYWDNNTAAHKPQLVAAANRIVRENAACASLDAGTLSKSGDRGTASKPVYFITCNDPKGDPFNVWFERDDAASSKSFAAAAHIDRGKALLACEQAARRAATNPETVDFSNFIDLAYLTYPNGRSRLLSSFTAKNALGVERKFTIGCLFEGEGLLETVVNEA